LTGGLPDRGRAEGIAASTGEKTRGRTVGMVGKLLHTRYRVTDLEKTISFYKDVLGLDEVKRFKSGRGSDLVFLKAPGSEEQIEICKFDESGPVIVGPDLTHLAFEVEDIQKFAEHAAKLGYPLSDGPHVSSSGSAIAFIDAPEGYEIELIQPAKK
jgi:lactoylglutathione lyase